MIAYSYNGISVFAVILESKKPVNRSYIIHSFHIKKELQGNSLVKCTIIYLYLSLTLETRVASTHFFLAKIC